MLDFIYSRPPPQTELKSPLLPLFFTPSLHHFVTPSPCHLVTLSLCYLVTPSPISSCFTPSSLLFFPWISLLTTHYSLFFISPSLSLSLSPSLSPHSLRLLVTLSLCYLVTSSPITSCFTPGSLLLFPWISLLTTHYSLLFISPSLSLSLSSSPRHFISPCFTPGSLLLFPWISQLTTHYSLLTTFFTQSLPLSVS